MTLLSYQWLRIGLVAIVGMALSPAAVLAQAGDDLDVTMRMVLDDDELTERVVQQLELPEPVGMESDRAPREFDGADQAAEARGQGRALGEQISEQVRGNREELPVGRGDGRLELPPALDDIRDDLPDLDPDAGDGGGLPDVGDLPDSGDLLDQDLLNDPALDN